MDRYKERITTKIISLILHKPNFISLQFLPILFRIKGEKEVGNGYKSLLKFLKSLNVYKAELSSVGTINITTSENFYKVAFNKNARKYLIKEYKNWEKLKSYTSFQEIINNRMNLFERDNILILEIAKLVNINIQEEKLSAIHFLFSEMRKDSYNGEVEKSFYLKEGLKFIENNFIKKESEIFNEMAEKIMGHKAIMGPLHGDMHVRNIMKDEEGLYKVIDLDKFSAKGIQSLDSLHTIIDYESRENKISWFKQAILFYEDKKQMSDFSKEIYKNYVDFDLKKLMILYILDRIGKETYENDKISNYWKCELDFLVKKITVLEEGIN